MPNGRTSWNAASAVDEAVKVLGRHRSVASAAAELGVTAASLYWAVKTYTGRTAGSCLAPPAPVAVAAAVEAEAGKRQVRDWQRELKDAYAANSALQARLQAFEQLSSAPIERITPRKLLKGASRRATAVVLGSDWHLGEVVHHSADMPNEYNLSVAEIRVSRFFEAIIWLIRNTTSQFQIDHLLLWLGGDIIAGAIHEDLLETVERPPGDVIVWARDRIVAGLKRILAALPDLRITVPCSHGNHGRTTPKMRTGTGYGHSWEWLLYQNLSAAFGGESRVKFHITHDEHQHVSVGDFRLAFHHGHRVRYNSGIGGFAVPLMKAVYRWDQWPSRADYYHIGHFHTLMDLGKISVNGSLVGPGYYSRAIAARPEPPQQLFYLLDDKRGKTSVSPIWVAEAQEVSK